MKEDIKFKLQCFQDVNEENIKWLWKPYLPIGMFVLIAGDPGIGKTYITSYLASVISTGGCFPLEEENTEKGNVIILNSEDSKSEIKKRLLQANANLENIFIVSNEKQIIKLNNVEILETFIKEKEPKLIIVDPLNSFIGNVDTSNDTSFRNAMFPMVELCKKYNVTLLCVSHFNKSADKSTYRVGGCLGGYMGMPRSVIYAIDNYVDDDEKIFAPIKNSYGQKGKAISYKITDNGIKWIQYINRINLDDFTSSQTFSLMKIAKDFIIDTLNERGKIQGKELEEIVLANEIKARTFQRARCDLKKSNIIDCIVENSKTYWVMKEEKKQISTEIKPAKNINGVKDLSGC